MGIISILLIAVGLAMDAFAVAVTNGLALKKVKIIHAFKFGIFFGFFQFIMPVIGWFCSKNFSSAIEKFDHWIAFILLVIIGGNMFIETFKKSKDNNIFDENILSFKNMIMLAVATSIDALAVGVSFAFIQSDNGLNIWSASLIIGAVAFIMSYIGLMIGKKIGGMFQKNAERIGGLILIGIGIKILVEHLYL